MDKLNIEGHELVTDLHLEIDKLTEERNALLEITRKLHVKIKNLTQETVQLKPPNNLELVLDFEKEL